MDDFKLTEKGEKFIQNLRGNIKESNRYRSHNLSLTLYLSEIPKGLEKNKAFCPFTNKRYSGLKTELLGCKFFYYGGNKANLYLTDVFADSREEILDKIHSLTHQIIQILKIEFEIEVNGFESYKLNTGHIALIGELEKVKGYFKDGNFAVDCSHNKPEVETENVDTMFENIDKLQNFKGSINSCRNSIKGGKEND